MKQLNVGDRYIELKRYKYNDYKRCDNYRPIIKTPLVLYFSNKWLAYKFVCQKEPKETIDPDMFRGSEDFAFDTEHAHYQISERTFGFEVIDDEDDADFQMAL